MRQNWQLWKGVLSDDECDNIIEICQNECIMQDGTVFSSNDYQPDKSIRDSKIGWTNNTYIKSLIEYYSKEANRNAFNVDANYVPPVQYGEYYEENFYSWHHDINWESQAAYDRKISVVIQLSNPDEYEGGDFQFKHIQTPQNFRTRGSVLAFLSYNTHQVTTVTQGTRRSLVAWVEGPRWR